MPIFDQIRFSEKAHRNYHDVLHDRYDTTICITDKEYGAIPGGVTDNTAAIQEALDAAKTAGGMVVFAPPGTYLTGQLIIPDKVWLVGAGKWATVFKSKNNTNAPLFKNYKAVSTEANAENWGLMDFGIDGNKGNQSSGSGIHVEFSSAQTAGDSFNDTRWTVQNVLIYNCKNHGVETVAPRTSGGRMVNVDVFYCDGKGFDLQSSDMKLEDCEVGSGGLAGFYIAGTSNQLNNCKAYFCGRITDTSGHGFQLNSGKGNALNGCHAQDNEAAGFLLENSTGRNNLSGCIADSNSTSGAGTFGGVQLTDTSYNLVDVACYERRYDAVNSYQTAALKITGSCLSNKIRLTHSGQGGGVVGAPVHSGSDSIAGNHITINGEDGLKSVAYASAITPDPYAGSMINVGALTGGITVNATTQQHTGQKLAFIFTQDGTGGRVVTWNAQYKVNWTPNTAASKINTIEFMFDGTNWIQTGAVTGI